MSLLSLLSRSAVFFITVHNARVMVNFMDVVMVGGNMVNRWNLEWQKRIVRCEVFNRWKREREFGGDGAVYDGTFKSQFSIVI